MAKRDENGHPRGIVIVDALWKYCPTEWQEWAREYFRRPRPEALREMDPKAYRAWPKRYPNDPPDGPPSSWVWLDGDERKLWHLYPTNRQPKYVAIPQADDLRPIWLMLRQRLVSHEVVASGFRDGSLYREDAPPEAWETLEWDLDVRTSSAMAPGIRFIEVRIRPRARPSTVGVETQCKGWIRERVARGPEPRSRDALFAEAQRQFGPELSERGFLRAWQEVAPDQWKRAGTKRKSPR